MIVFVLLRKVYCVFVVCFVLAACAVFVVLAVCIVRAMHMHYA